MVFSKVLGSNNYLSKKKMILNKINKGYMDKKKKININFFYISKKENKFILLLKKKNLINFFFNNNKFHIIFNKNKKFDNYNIIFLKYFENKPFYVF